MPDSLAKFDKTRFIVSAMKRRFPEVESETVDYVARQVWLDMAGANLSNFQQNLMRQLTALINDS